MGNLRLGFQKNGIYIMKKILLTLSAIAVLSACKSTPPVQYEQVSIPSINAQTTAYLGERMLMQAKGHYANCIEVSGGSGVQSVIKAGQFCQRNVNGALYFSHDAQAVGLKNGYGNVINYVSHVTYDAEKNEVCASTFSCYNSNEMSIAYKDKDFVVQPNSMQQIIEYNGRTGSVLNFTYREFSSGMARSAFTTDFKMDLNEGDEIGYKGSRMTIHEATNNKITYTVLKNFN